MPRRPSVGFCVFVALATAMLAGCASDDATSRLLVAPDKYVLYSCDEIAREAQAKSAREQELRGLMAKAGADPGGRMISGVAYDPEYLSVRGEMNDLRAAAISKDCKTVPDQAPAAPTGAIH